MNHSPQNGTHKSDVSSAGTIHRLIIDGGRQLQGTVSVTGAKNAVSKQLVASVLTDEPCVFTNVPRIAEIDSVLQMLSDVGTQSSWLDRNCLRLHTPTITSSDVGQRYSGYNRIPILMLSPLLHRVGHANVPVVGGCQIGPRPVDFHLNALEAMGADIQQTDSGYHATASKLKGTVVSLPFPSVGATETTLLAAVLATGTTVICNAAIEPEIIDTILFLQKMGAQISVGVNRRIVVEGVDFLHGTQHETVPDRIEVASFAAAAVATSGSITVQHARQDHMTSFLNPLRKTGGGFRVDNGGITFFRRTPNLSPLHLETGVHPGFMTDWQQPMCVVLTQAEGTSVIHETVYEERFGYTTALRAMGAEISLAEFCLGQAACRFRGLRHQHSCLIRGVTRLEGAPVVIPDLRAGFAHLIAALVAHGQTELSGIAFLERGYADIPEKLESINARIEVVREGPQSRPQAA